MSKTCTYEWNGKGGKTAWSLEEDVLLLYTDGVSGASGPQDEPYGIARLERVLLSSRGDAKRIVRTCFRDIAEFTRRRGQSDDRTLLAVRVTEILSNNRGNEP